MSIRRLSAYVPPAVLVGAGVHVAASGFEHVPGGQRAGALFALLAAAIVFALGAAFLAGAAGRLPLSIATGQRRVYGILTLALAGTAAYALIEAMEGHIGLGGLTRALLASFPLAALVLAVSRRAEAAAVEAGSCFRI
ncbi:MAG: hypothetical protein IAI49_12495, partial [Candidatus Eremiobacteraeota bacterium]|nr:hypothetical protein [Candidatus Eremiobacteraeota bacterium]